MEEEETWEGVTTLIQQRTQRPPFARMISWEMSKGSSPRRRRPSKKVKQYQQYQPLNPTEEDDSDSNSCTDDGISTDSDNSVYLTADESVSESDSDHTHMSERTESCLPSVFTDLSVENDSSMMKLDSVSVLPGERRRRLSKKQKKKKKRIYKVEYIDTIFHCTEKDKFGSSCLDEAFFDLVDLLEDSKKIQVFKHVPTLVEVCLKSAWAAGSTFTEKPCGLKSIIQSHKQQRSFSSLQLQMLHKHLSHLESMDCHSLTAIWHYDGKNYTDNRYVLWRAKRNVFNGINIHPPNRQADCDVVHTQYLGHRASSFLRWTSFSLLNDNTDLYGNIQTWHSLVSTISVLGHSIDLMLPSTLANRTKKILTDDNELNRQNTRTASIKVREALRARFPRLVEKLFDEALAYVFWARGNVSQAVELFFKLANQETKTLDKAMFFSEVGRMYAQLDDQHQAHKFYRLASDAALEMARTNINDDIMEINQQLLILIANVCDQGLMTTEKAREAASTWSSVYHQEVLSTSILWAALDSFLCFHCGSLPDVYWLSEAEGKLRALVKKEPSINIYYSVVLALQGNEDLSMRAFRDYSYAGMSSGDHLDSRYFFSERKVDCWASLLHNPCKQKPTPMRVLWRVQFQSALFATEIDARVADFADKEISLRITPDGYVTANIQQLLPPLRGVYLDPYTGQRIIKSNPLPTEVWTDCNAIYGNSISGDMLCLPTPVEVYCDEEGNRVQLVCSSEALYIGYNPVCEYATVFWSNKNGQRARVNLLPPTRKIAYDHVSSQIQTNAGTKGKKGDWKNEMEKVLNYNYAKGKNLSYYNFVSYVAKCDQTKRKAKKEGVKWVKPSMPKFDSFGVNVFRLVQYGQMLFIHLQDRTCVESVCFFRCTDSESFKNFRISHLPETIETARSIIPNKRNNRVPGSIMWFTKGYNYTERGSFCSVIDDTGKEILHPEAIKTSDSHGISTPYVLGSKLYGVHDDNTRILINKEGYEKPDEIPDFPSIKGMDTVGNKVLLHTVEGVGFLDSERHLPQSILIKGSCPSVICIKDNSSCIEGIFEHVDVLDEKKLETVTRVVITLDSFVCIVDVPLDTSESDSPIVIRLCVNVPGIPVEAVSVESMGLLVSASLNKGVKTHYRENVYFYSNEGNLCRYLPMVGPGPRSFCLHYFPQNEEVRNKFSEFGMGGLHLFMNDGHGGIIAVLLLEE